MRRPVSRAVSACLVPLVAGAALIASACSGPGEGLDAHVPGLDGAAIDGGPPPDARPVDPCDPNPCTEAGRTVCEAPLGIAECGCDAGYELIEGRCERATTCTDTTCSGHGECAMGEEGPECTCELGHAGERCETCDDAAGYYDDGRGGCTLDACTPSPCTDPTRALCTVVDRVAVCACNAGTHDEGGVCVPDATCTGTSCAGHGTCTMADGATACACDEGWGGARCDACDAAGGYHADGAGGCTRDACLPNPCTAPRRSVCTSDGATTSCGCDPGSHLEGDACVLDETCAADTCSMHGACAVIGGLARCTCDDGWDGSACDACAAGWHDDGAGGCTTDVCLPNPCTAPEQTTCVAMGATPTCACDPGAHPDGMGGCTTDPCVPDPCVAGNQACRVVGTTYECFVPPCDDGNPCTDDAVVGGSCMHSVRANGTACSTGVCSVDQTCTAGVCGGGSARACDDGNPCTRDACLSPAGCTFTNDDTLVPPDDAFACTAARCASGSAAHVPVDARCDDGRWCTGEDVCRPGAGADSRGCVVEDVPVAPGPSTPCAFYACSDATSSFTRTVLPAGGACDDGIPCTTGDACDTSAVCAGAVTALCDVGDPGTASCTPSGSLVTAVDIGIAPVTGTITQNGVTLPMTTPAYENGVIWARARDTGRLHRLAVIDWTRSGSYPSYSRTATSDRIRTTVVPGVYDVLYQRAYQSSSEYVSERMHLSSGVSDPVVNGYRVIQSGVVIPAGGRTLDVDIGATIVTGTITQNGATLPTTTPAYENGVIWARARDTGKLHRLAVIDWTRSGSYPSYSRSASSDQIRSMVVPGRYDILYQRAYQASSEYVSEQMHLSSGISDPVVNGYRMLREDVAIGGASQVLDLDVGVTAITGTITQNGATLPMTTPAYENGVIWARARDTGRLHRLAVIDWTRSGSYPSYSRSATSDQIRTALVPGRYDLLYQRAYQGSGQYVSEQMHLTSGVSDPVVNGYRVLREDVVVGGGAQVIDVDVGVTAITGTITQNGATLPTTTPAYENGVIWARARDTGKLHRLAVIDWTRSGSYPAYSRSATSDRIRSMLVPGRYDILYQRGYQGSSEYVSEQMHLSSGVSDPVVNGYRVLREDVLVSGASQVIDVDVGVTAITGTITQNGATLPMTTPAYENGVVWARARDTGKLHRVAVIDWTRSGSYPTYSRSATSDRIRTTLVPGAYDLLYQRAYQSSSQYVSEQMRLSSGATDPVVNGYRVLRENVVVGGSAQVIDVDIRSVVVAGTITMNGATLPTTTPAYENGVLWLRSRDTARLHRLAIVDWTRSGSYPSYSRSATSDRFSSTMMPGAYDLLYQRGYQSSADYVSEQMHLSSGISDPVVNGYRVLQACVLVE